MPDNIIEVCRGDITTIHADAIVNAANSTLMGGGGVDGAIHRAGGPAILEACKKIVARQGGCKPGSAVITTAGLLHAKFVIHTVGPVWHGGKNNEEAVLRSCYLNSLQLAVQNNCASLAFPGISTGAYNFPKQKAAKIGVTTVHEFTLHNPSLQKVLFVCFDDGNYNCILNELSLLKQK